MRSLLAFMKKEWMEQLRCGRLMILVILFVLLGIMNPAMAKLTPWLFEVMADSLAESGITVTAVTVSALDSWTQFFKNLPLGLIAFVLLQSSIFTKEYDTGTLMLVFTKGFERIKVLTAKASLLLILWSAGYWLCFGITCGYNAYFWDNTVAHNLMFAVICWWIFGLWVITLCVLFSVLAKSNAHVLAGTGSIVLLFFLLGMFPQCREYVPTVLTDGASLIYGARSLQVYLFPLIFTVILGIFCLAVSIPLFRQKKL